MIRALNGRRWAVLGLGLLLAGCATAPKTLYSWGSYQPSLYQYLKTDGGDVGTQIETLEALAEKNRSGGLADPPGLHGHLALLYSKSGNEAAAKNQLEIERRLFPESAAYIDFLLKKSAQPVQKAEADHV
jgi:hypothetical protein